ncbi:MAG: cbb3-type cytochrome oxidase assembly protein CcoS [Erythrobacter sp.]|nr:cbb3-type cytochrome oxidase assembly protein CcoS [Erythrobacter sp.]MBL4858639.1 cbb3-type cytochrome oxidase assembly protein CcoS [Erythrobacter sp.]
MNVLVFLIPVALFLSGAGLVLFFWAMRDGQFEDLDGAANRILIDDEEDAQLARTEEEESLR